MNKKTIMFFSALMILIFHLWIRLTNSTFENYLLQLCVVGVDLFFLVSAYSIAKSKKDYKSFVKNRFLNIYIKFVIFTIVYIVFSSKGFIDLIKILLGIEFFNRGGGSFLWFIPAIMITYLLLPLYKEVDKKHPKVFIPIIIMYLLITVLISTLTSYNAIFIFVNRIPIILIGYYLGKYSLLEKKINKKYILTMIISIVLGSIISYYSYVKYINLSFFYDIKYIINIPITIGLLLLFNLIKDNKVTEIIGSATLEIYAIQMIFGFKLANKLYMLINNKILTNISIILLVVLISVIINLFYIYITNKITKKRKA